MKRYQSESAVAPVISIVLIVAVVVILAAVVSMVALGTIGGTQGNSKSVHLTASKGSSGITFTVQGGMDLPSVTSLDFVNGNTITNCTGASPKIGTTCSGVTDSTGRSVIVASFADGTKQVVYDKNWGSVSSGSAANEYLVFTITGSVPGDATYPYWYTVTYSRGPKWSDIKTLDVDDGEQNLLGQNPSVVESWVSGGTTIKSVYQFTKLKVTAHLTDGSTVTITDQSLT